MRLFHVSEEENIDIFMPRAPKREYLQNSKPLVWAVCSRTLPNYLLPRECPRVTYHVHANTIAADINKFFISKTAKHAIIIEKEWVQIIKDTIIYIYEFETKNFHLQDEVAGYYVSEKKEIPIKKIMVEDLFSELSKRNIEIRIVDNLSHISQKVQESTLNWSLCRMRNAKS